MKLELPNVTLIGVDCVNLERLQLAADISTKDINFGAVKLLTSIKSDDHRVIEIPHINSTKKYSKFMIKELYKYIDTEFVLVFQYDGFVLNASAWSDSFLQYDYIGGPWYHLGDLRVGNGGFSLRSKKLIDWLGHNWRKVNAHIHPEDVYISKFARPHLEKEGMKFAPEEVALDFSIDGDQRSNVWNGQFGFHGLNWTDISNWLINHPDYKDSLPNKLSDFFLIMKKYPIYDGTVHTFRFKKQNLGNYTQISKGIKKYEARLILDKYFEYKDIKIGDVIIFKKSGKGIKNNIPSFEKNIKNIETFESFQELRNKYPKINVTYPIKDISKWKRLFVNILGDFIYPKNNIYKVFWFD
jgi:ASC-1-like (ASCH) protein